MSRKRKESEAERIAREAKERELENLLAQKQREHQYRGVEQGAELESQRDIAQKEHGRRT